MENDLSLKVVCHFSLTHTKFGGNFEQTLLVICHPSFAYSLHLTTFQGCSPRGICLGSRGGLEAVFLAGSASHGLDLTASALPQYSFCLGLASVWKVAPCLGSVVISQRERPPTELKFKPRTEEWHRSPQPKRARPRGHLILCHTVWFKATKFGTAIHLQYRGRFFRGSPRLGLASNLVCLASRSLPLPRLRTLLPWPLPMPRIDKTALSPTLQLLSCSYNN